MRRWMPLLVAVACSTAWADEGMWPPAQLPELGAELTKRGLRIDPGRLADLTADPMNAVISLGGCTASFVSPDGLVVTNHHCAYGAIQYNSTEDRNLLDQGFVATERGEELFAGPGSRVLVTVEVQDVTDTVLDSLPETLSGRERYQKIEDREKKLIADCEEDEGYRCRVASFYGGLQYQLVKQLEIKDVRLVYAPPGSVGKYGGDIDNWMWPRHTGDFSFYRAYVSPEGKPAEHSENNVPFQPKHFLRIEPRGLQDGDFVMVAGYPGRTNRYRLATEVEETIDWRYPTLRQVFTEWLEVIETSTAGREDAALKYASLVAGLNNAAKNYQGMLEGFAKSDIIERKQRLERDLQAWIQENPERKDRYLSAVRDLEALVAEDQAVRERDLYYRWLAHRSTLLGTAETLYRLSRERQKPDAEREPGYQERDFERIRERLTRMDRTFDADVDQASWHHFIGRYAAQPVSQHVAPFDAWFGISGNQVEDRKLDRRLKSMYRRTGLDDLDTRLAWMEKPRAEFESSDDPVLQLAVQLFDTDFALEEEDKDRAGRFQEARHRYMEALIAFMSSRGKEVYPDANGTLRVTFGVVGGSSPRDGLRYAPFTTLEGILEKDTGEEPFDSPEDLLAAIRAKRYAGYALPAIGSVPVNFLTNVDTTGGNSGSPTLNGEGKLVGLLFDGTYESIISDWDFLRDKNRSIHVDIRYVLWVMDQLGGADHLLQEMGVKPAGELRAGGGRSGSR